MAQARKPPLGGRAKQTALGVAAWAAGRPPLRALGDAASSRVRGWPRERGLGSRLARFWCAANLAAPSGATDRMVRLRAGAYLKVSLTEAAGRDVFIYGELDPEISRVLPELVRPGAVVLDIGANMGYYTCLLAARVGPRGRVIAFEPNQAPADRLWASVVRNGFQDRVRLVRAAVADQAGSLTFFPSPDPVNSGLSSLLRHPHLAASTPVQVPAITVDSYLEEVGLARVDFIKMDVECAEILVLRGMPRLLAAAPPPFIVSEVTESPAQLVSGRELIAAFAAWGYRPYDIGPAGLTAFDPNRAGFSVVNVCFVHRTARAPHGGGGG